MRYNYKWNLKDAVFTKDKGTVFSCFACGGGSTMGYKLAGFDVIGCNEIDPKMMEAYRVNHNPKFSYLEPIQTFKDRDDLPDELYNLDILDGSPPCSSFSMAGNREKDWGKDKKFREGQASQVLDTLFFDFIDLAKKLQPKIVVAENVKGMLLGSAKEYVIKVYQEFKRAGYQLRIRPYLLDASKMGVPQRRERVFFIAIRNDLSGQFMEQVDMFQRAPKLMLDFNEPPIPFSVIHEPNNNERGLSERELHLWNNKTYGDTDFSTIKGRLFDKPNSNFGWKFLYSNKVSNTITGGDICVLFDEPRYRSKTELCKCGTYPLDYNFLKIKTEYLIGMSVPPVMMAMIAHEISEQWLTKLK
jgi:DNA (cytosine-5)-methyltransferase 1